MNHLMNITAKKYQPTKISGHCYIGDPCYVVPDEYWSEFCNQLEILGCYRYQENSFYNDKLGVTFHFERNNQIFSMFVAGTAYGDGCYEIHGSGEAFGVDAGLFCVFNIKEFIEFFGEEFDQKQLDDGISLDVDGIPEFDGKGNMILGKYFVDTSGSGEEDEEDEGD